MAREHEDAAIRCSTAGIAPMAYVAPWEGRGDWLYLAATPDF
jgi:hypothetical protein